MEPVERATFSRTDQQAKWDWQRWSIGRVSEWVNTLGGSLPSCAEVLAKSQMDGSLLMTIAQLDVPAADATLQEMGVSSALNRTRLITAIRGL